MDNIENIQIAAPQVQKPSELLSYNPPATVLEQTFMKKPPDKTCNGKIHRQFKYCKKPAGWGTNHQGKGRCKLHGGCCTGPKSGTLRYSDFVPSVLVERYEEFAVESKEDILSLDNEIALVRARITSLEELNQNGIYNKDLLQFVELVRRLVETKQKLEDGLKTKVTFEFAGKFVDAIVNILDECVLDANLKKDIAGRMRRLNEVQLGINVLNTN